MAPLHVSSATIGSPPPFNKTSALLGQSLRESTTQIRVALFVPLGYSRSGEKLGLCGGFGVDIGTARFGTLVARLRSRLSGGATKPFQADLPLRPPPNPSRRPALDPIWSRFRPDLDLETRISGPNQVRIRSRLGPSHVFGGGRGWRGRSGWDGPAAPRNES